MQIQFSLSLIYKLAESVDILDSHEKKKNTNPWRDDGIFFLSIYQRNWIDLENPQQYRKITSFSYMYSEIPLVFQFWSMANDLRSH